MVVVETIALSTMVCQRLVMPVLLRWKSLGLAERRDLTGLCWLSAAGHCCDSAARLCYFR